MQLLQDSPQRLFRQYLLPSIGATMVTSIYVLADSIMIGKGLGELAIAALNLVLPFFNLFFGTGAMLGVGGGILFSVAMGRQDEIRARHYFSVAALMLAVFAAIYVSVCLHWFEPLLYFLGATHMTLTLAKEYAIWLVMGAPVFMINVFLQSFIRNDQAPRLAMAGVITGGVLNTFLDWLFIFPMQMGMAGAAIASVIGSGSTILVLVAHFFRKKNHLRFSLPVKEASLMLSQVTDILRYGFTTFIMEISGGIMILIFNLQALRYAGEIGVAMYSVLTNSSYVVISISNGIAQAAQPLIASNMGAGLMDRIRQFRLLGLKTAGAVGAVLACIGLAFPFVVVYVFLNPTQAILDMTPVAVRIYFAGYLFAAMNIFFVTYFQATLHAGISMLLSMLRGFVLTIALAFLLPPMMGISGIWTAYTLAECITFGIAFRLAGR